MIDKSASIALLLAALMLGTMAGFFYAFSVCVMPGLDAARPAAAIEAMQEINRVVRNPVFFTSFFVTPAVAAGAALLCWQAGRRRAAYAAGLATLTYLAGAMAPTIVVNVPLNQALAAYGDGGNGLPAADMWRAYSPAWTGWNTARAGYCLAATAFALLALATPAAHTRDAGTQELRP